MEKRIAYFISDYANYDDYRKGLLAEIDKMEKEGYRNVAGEPIEEIRAVHLGNVLTYEKEID